MITSTNLYEIFGLKRTASSAEIKAAYREKIFKLHPDQAADPADFHIVQSAYDTLSDVDKRAFYDSCGVIGASQDDIQKKAEALVAEMADWAVEQYGGDSPRVISGILQLLASQINGFRQDQDAADRKAARCLRAAERITRKGGVKNFISERLMLSASVAQRQSQETALSIAVHEHGMKVAKEYSFETGMALPVPGAPRTWTDQERSLFEGLTGSAFR